MIVAISGTPGTGKTSVARIVATRMRARLIPLSAVAKEIPHTLDEKRRTKIVDPARLSRAVREKIKESGKDVVIEGHMAHLIPADFVVVLRCNPVALRKRLLRKKWGAAKIRENVEAELIDLITAETAGRTRDVVEVDTSRRNPERTARLILKLLNNIQARQAYRVGRIDWACRYTNAVM